LEMEEVVQSKRCRPRLFRHRPTTTRFIQASLNSSLGATETMSEGYLRRYTDIPALAYLLSERKITLLDPKSWDDSNDSHYISVYKNKKNLKTVLALCFAQAAETYHHWRVFSGSSSGACIRFKRAELLKAVKGQMGVKTGKVQYLTLDEIRAKKLETRQLPFIKRYAFEDEHEYRVIFESTTQSLLKLDLPIPLSCIDRVTLSPWIHKSLVASVKKMLKSIDGCRRIEFVRSTLVSNEEWKNIGGTAV
jgi:hypothetical protein